MAAKRASNSQCNPPVVCLLDHCVFCLRKTDSSITSELDHGEGDGLAVVPEGQVGDVQAFNLTWSWIQKCRKLEEEDGWFWWANEPINCTPVEIAVSKMKFTKPFTLCQFCASLVTNVERTMKELRTQVLQLRQVIEQSKTTGELGWRGQNFISNLEEERVPTNLIDSTIKFLDCLGANQVQATVNVPPRKKPKIQSSLNISNNLIETDPRVNFPQEMNLSKEALETRVELKPELDEESDENPLSVRTNSLADIKDEHISDSDFVNSGPDSAGTQTQSSNNLYNLPSFEPVWSEELQKYMCPHPICQKSPRLNFSSKAVCLKHLGRVHRCYLCPCGTKFPTCKQRDHHKKTSPVHKSRFRSKSQRCDLCDEVVLFKDILQHVQHHVGDYVLKCPDNECRYVFSNVPSLRHHVSLSKFCKQALLQKGKSFACDRCSFKTEKMVPFRSHLSVEHERGTDKPYCCPLPGCAKRFSMKQSVSIHIGDHKDLKPVPSTQKCEKCEEKVETGKMSEHLKDKHGCEEIIKCLQCPLMFATRGGLLEHLFVHRQEGILCDVCNNGVRYPRHIDVRRHYETAHQVPIKVYLCPECGKELYNKNSLQSHVALVHKQVNWKSRQCRKLTYKCDKCLEDKSFATYDGLVRHQIEVHGAEPFSCDICEQEFSSMNQFARHKKEHAGIEAQKEWKCEVEGCNQVFSRKAWLKRHVESGHEKRRDHLCTECGKTYYESASLRDHYEVKHLGLRKWVCDHCNESFTDSNTLKRHQLIHTGERPFMCSECGQMFRHKEVMQRHLRAHQEKGHAFKPKGPMKAVRRRKALN